MSNRIKIVAIGDPKVGKSNLFRRFIQRDFVSNYVPTVIDNFSCTIPNCNKELQFWDTAGDSSMENLRVLSYPCTDLFLICFDISDPDSFNNITRVWIPELRQYVSHAKYALIGLKKELRNDQQILQQLSDRELRPVSREQGISKAREIGAILYSECSSILNENVNELLLAITSINYENDYKSNISTAIQKMGNKLGPKFFFKKRNRTDTMSSTPEFFVV